MTPASSPALDGPLPTAPELANGARDFRLRMAVIDSETETALDMTRDRYGRTVHAGAAAAARAHRDKAAVEAYATHLAPHAEALLDAARLVLDELPPARHLAGWRAVLDGLAASAAEIRRALDRPAAPGSQAERTQHAALWPHGLRLGDRPDGHRPLPVLARPRLLGRVHRHVVRPHPDRQGGSGGVVAGGGGVLAPVDGAAAGGGDRGAVGGQGCGTGAGRWIGAG